MVSRVRQIKNWVYIIFGSFLMALAVKFFYDPCGLVTGGFSGISVILKKVLHVPLFVTMGALNVPLLFAAWKRLGWRRVSRTILGAALLTFFIAAIPEPKHMPTEDLFLSSMYGGVLTGLGIGFVFLAEASTGGTDLIAVLISRRFRGVKETKALQYLDGAVVLLGLVVFGVQMVLYAIFSIALVSWLSERILEGAEHGKMLLIISEKNEMIARELMARLDRGATGLKGVGKYSGREREVLLCVVQKKEINATKETIFQIDPMAFVIFTDVREVVGEGFIKVQQD